MQEALLTCAHALQREAYAVHESASIVRRERKHPFPKGCMINKARTPYDALMDDNDSGESDLNNLVQDFTKLDLTYAEDRADAFAGIARRIDCAFEQDLAPTSTTGGLTKSLFNFAFDRWSMVGSGPHSRVSQRHAQSRGLPTWYWMGMGGFRMFQRPYIPPAALGGKVRRQQ
jgi:hypothetical protein